jgi:hypothetical protein
LEKDASAMFNPEKHMDFPSDQAKKGMIWVWIIFLVARSVIHRRDEQTSASKMKNGRTWPV